MKVIETIVREKIIQGILKYNAELSFSKIDRLPMNKIIELYDDMFYELFVQNEEKINN